MNEQKTREKNEERLLDRILSVLENLEGRYWRIDRELELGVFGYSQEFNEGLRLGFGIAFEKLDKTVAEYMEDSYDRGGMAPPQGINPYKVETSSTPEMFGVTCKNID